MSKPKVLYPPLKLISTIEKNCPGAFEAYEKLLKAKPDALEFDICAQVSSLYYNKNQVHRENLASVLYTLISWRKTKQVYRISKQLQELISDTEDFKLSPEIFEYLPFPCFYLEIDGSENIHGVFVKLIHTEVNYGIILTAVKQQGQYWFTYLDFKEGSDLDTLTYYEYINKTTKGFLDPGIENLRQCLIWGIQCSLYLCAKNCDIQENEEQKKIHRPIKDKIRDRYSEIRKWDVGYRIVTDFKNHPKSNAEKSSDSQRQRPRQHWRKAHWHTYWVGKGRQKKELKFIAPILVNDIKDNLPIVEHQ